MGINERNAANTLQDTLAGSFQTAPTFWLNPASGVSYPLVVQMPQYRMGTIGDLNNTPLTGANGSFQLLGGLAKVTRVPNDAVVSHYNVQPSSTSTRPRTSATWAPSPLTTGDSQGTRRRKCRADPQSRCAARSRP